MHANHFSLHANYFSAALITLSLAACGGVDGIDPARRADGPDLGTSSSTGAGGPSINGGPGSPSVNGGSGGPGINGGPGGPGLDNPVAPGPGGAGGGCHGDSAICLALEAAFASEAHTPFDCSFTDYPGWTVSQYVTPDQANGSGQCAFRDGDLAGALGGCWAFHCTTVPDNCDTYATGAQSNACNAQALCSNGGTVGNETCTTQSQLPCSALLGFSCGT